MSSYVYFIYDVQIFLGVVSGKNREKYIYSIFLEAEALKLFLISHHSMESVITHGYSEDVSIHQAFKLHEQWEFLWHAYFSKSTCSSET